MANTVKITVKAEDLASKTLKSVSERATGLSDKLREIRGPLLAVTGALTGTGIAAIKFASDLEQSRGGVEAVFGDMSESVLEFSETAATRLGLSQRAFNEAILPLAAMMKNAGVETEQMTERVLDLSVIAADLAAAFGGSTQEALNALAAAFRGEADPIERFGLSLKITDINARAMAMGLAESTDEITAQQKATAFMNLVMEQTADIQGQVSREAESVAFRFQQAKAQFEDAGAALGEQLLPAASKVLGVIANLVEKFGNLPAEAKTVILAVGGVTAGFAALGLVIPPLIGLMTAFGVASNIALAGIPLIIAGITAGVTLLILKWEEVVKFMKGAGGWILAAFGPIGLAAKLVIDNWELLIDVLREVFNAAVRMFNGLVDNINDVIDAMNNVAGVFGQEIPRINFQLSEWEKKTKDVADTVTRSYDFMGSAAEEASRQTGMAAMGVGETVAQTAQTVEGANFRIIQSNSAAARSFGMVAAAAGGGGRGLGIDPNTNMLNLFPGEGSPMRAFLDQFFETGRTPQAGFFREFNAPGVAMPGAGDPRDAGVTVIVNGDVNAEDFEGKVAQAMQNLQRQGA